MVCTRAINQRDLGLSRFPVPALGAACIQLLAFPDGKAIPVHLLLLDFLLMFKGVLWSVPACGIP